MASNDAGAHIHENQKSRERFRRKVLVSLGAAGSEIDQLLEYGCSRFLAQKVHSLPLDDELFATAWRDYAEEAAERGVFAVLREKLVQLRFPVRKGISLEGSYRAATLRGDFSGCKPMGLEPVDPDGLRLFLHQTPAGKIPVLTVRERRDFVDLVRALSMHNEPEPVPESMGAVMVAGLSNWDRIARYRRAWQLDHPVEAGAGGWPAEFSLLIPRKDLYQDRLIILSEGEYSGVPAERVGMTQNAWRRASLIIRLEHECAHYFTKRMYGSMNNAVHDEFIADYAGIAAAAGAFRADWFLLFMGLEDYPNYRQGGRLQNYLSDPQPSARVFAILQRLVRQAAENLELFETRMRTASGPAATSRTEILLALAGLHMEELASPSAGRLIEERLQALAY
jgi:hypothetical protein